MGSTRAITLLHLSDLHFGRFHRFEQANGLGSLLDRLREDLDERRDKDGLGPDLVIVSGDLAEHGKKEEFERAHQFLEGLARLLALPARRVVIIPGNHDIHRKKSSAYFDDCEAEGITPEEPYFPKFAFYKQLFDRVYQGENDIGFSAEEPWSFFAYPDLGVVVAGMNSVMAESHRDDDHYGFLGERQLRAFAEKLRPYKEQGLLRIGAMHHDPRQRRGGARAEQDFKDLKKRLGPSLNLLLHGDVHEDSFEWLEQHVPILGIGSAAVGVEQRAAEIPNLYQIVQIQPDSLRFGLRAYVPDQNRWVGSPRADREGERWLQEKKIPFDRVHALGSALAPSAEQDLAKVVENYRRAVARNQGMPTVFDLLGVNEAGEARGGLDFLRVFVPQHASRVPLPRPERRRDDDLSTDEPPPLPERPERLDVLFSRSQSIEELLAGRWVFLLGAPGAGKTALTRWLLLKLCTGGERIAGLDEALMPVRVEMRRFDEAYRRANGKYGFFDYLDQEHGELYPSARMRGDTLRKLGEEGRLYWLFDGLDEVVDANQRRRYAEMIAGLVDDLPKCRGLVTSRPAGAEVAQPLLERAGLVSYTLEDFSDDQRDQFLDAWHEQVFAADPSTGRHRRTRMAQAISSTPSLRELCKNPLLCALLAYLNRQESPPERRHRLYQKVLERMAEQWDANKGLASLPTVERFDLEDKLLFLRRLAWSMLEDPERGAGNAIEAEALEDFAARFCEAHWGQAPHAARRRAEGLLRELRERNYVLAFFGGTTYGFAHRAFLEYLAALEASERFRGQQWKIGDLEKLFAAHWRESAWEEALLLLCGLLQESGAEYVVRVLQGIAGEDRALVYGSLYRYLDFCIMALSELPQLERGVANEFARGINDLFEIEIKVGNSGPFALQNAFRRVVGKWPEIDRLVAAGKIAPWTMDILRVEYYSWWISVAGRPRRLPILLVALEGCGIIGPSMVFKEAAALGPWSPDEIESICKAAETRNYLERFNILAAVVLTKGTIWKGNDLPIQSLLDIMRSPNSPADIRLSSAWFLVRASCHVDEALHYLRDNLRSDDEGLAMEAAICLAIVGYGAEALDVLARHAPKNEVSMLELVRLARTNDTARRALREALTRLRRESDPSTFLDIAWSLEREGYSLVSHGEIISHLHAIENETVADSKLRDMTTIPSLCPLAVSEYKARYESATSFDQRSTVVEYVPYISPRHAGPALVEFWVAIMSSEEPNIATYIAGTLLRREIESTLRERARNLLLPYLNEEQPEDVRRETACYLGINDPAGREALYSLARTAKAEGNRFTAAYLVGDLESLNTLSEKADNPDRRKIARHALDIYAHIGALLHIGRPRRARVRLHGRDAGILEELKAGGGTRFQYRRDYIDAPDARPLSPSMPLSPEPDTWDDGLHPFFDNLLPEGPLYDRTARRLGLRRADRFGILLHVGGDVMGAVEVLPPENA